MCEDSYRILPRSDIVEYTDRILFTPLAVQRRWVLNSNYCPGQRSFEFIVILKSIQERTVVH